MRILSALFLALLLSAPVFAADFQVQCQKFPAPLPGGFCVHAPVTGGSTDVVYHLHGLGGNEMAWQDQWFYTQQIRAEWEASGAAIPTVISISFGPLWLLAEKNTSEASGLFEIFTRQVLPMIEANLGGVKGRRILVGESMGGFNSVQLSLKTDLFAKVAILGSPMSEVSPFASETDVDAYVKKSSAWRYYQKEDPSMVTTAVQRSIELARYFFPSPAEWDQGSPLALAAAKRASYPRFYVSVGFYDRYVSYEANERFVNLLRSNGANVEWRPLWGGHLAMDIPSLAKFLVE